MAYFSQGLAEKAVSPSQVSRELNMTQVVVVYACFKPLVQGANTKRKKQGYIQAVLQIVNPLVIMALCAALSARILLQKHHSQKVPEGRCELTGNSGRSHRVCEEKSMEHDLKAVLNNSSIIINLVTTSSHAALQWEGCPRFAEAEIQASRNGASIPRDAAEKQGSAFLGRRAIHRAALPPYRDQMQWHRNSLLAVLSSLAGALGKHFPLGPAEQR